MSNFFKSGTDAPRTSDLDDIRERASPVGDRVGISGEATPVGPSTDVQPASLISDVDRGGSKAHSFFDDFYNRVYFIPSFVAFGSISTEVSRTIQVWNAHVDPTQLTGINITDGVGLELDGPSAPYDFAALEFTSYTVTALLDGPPLLDSSIQFIFDTPETFDLGVSGTRAKVSPFWPNWRQPYQIDYQFKSGIFTTRSGKEQRRALRSTPRKTVNFEATPTGAQAREFNELMANWHNNAIVLPEMPRQAALGVESAPGDLSVTLAEAAPDWMVEDATVVFTYKGQSESRLVDTVVGSVVSFTSESGVRWPVGAKVHPGVSGRLSTSISASRETNTANVVKVELDVTPVSEPFIPLPPAPVTFNGREVFTLRPNWVSPPEVTHEAVRDLIDFGRGKTATFTPVDFTTQIRRATYTSRGYEDMNLIREHFSRMRGQRGEFYMDTGEPDIIPGPASPALSNSIRIYGTDFVGAYGDSTIHKAVLVRYADGTVQRNVVTSIHEVDDADGLDSVVQVADTWTQEVSRDNVIMVSWLLVWRHATDTLTIEWLTDRVGRCQLTVRSLEDLA